MSQGSIYSYKHNSPHSRRAKSRESIDPGTLRMRAIMRSISPPNGSDSKRKDSLSSQRNTKLNLSPQKGEDIYFTGIENPETVIKGQQYRL